MNSVGRAEMNQGIAGWRIAESPIAIIDFETTGLIPGYDRVIEVSVVRIDPGDSPRLVLDTLVDPQRPIAFTEIHGITDDDIRSAPKFREVAGDILTATHDCVVAAYNVYFDMKFLRSAMQAAGVGHEPPHLCLMYLRPALGLGKRCKLATACELHGIDYSETHVAAHDAIAAGQLCVHYLTQLHQRSINTFSDLARLRAYKFYESFANAPFPKAEDLGLKLANRMVSRAGFAPPADPVRQAAGAYWDALKTVLTDLEITDDELVYVQSEQDRGILKPEQIRVLHARAFASVMSQFTSDQWLDDRETRKLRKLHQCLAKLGWAPGM